MRGKIEIFAFARDNVGSASGQPEGEAARDVAEDHAYESPAACDEGAAAQMRAAAKRNDKMIFMDCSCAHSKCGLAPLNVRRH